MQSEIQSLREYEVTPTQNAVLVCGGLFFVLLGSEPIFQTLSVAIGLALTFASLYFNLSGKVIEDAN